MAFETNYQDDELVDTLQADGDVGLATLEYDDAAPAAGEWTGPQCEKCEAPLKSDVVSICRICGWYASLATFVELDPNWETEADEGAPAAAQPESQFQVLLNLVPRWGWVIIGSVLVIIAESIVARLATPAGSGLRTAWSLTQLAIGAVVVTSCHVFNFLSLAADDAEIGLLDLFLKPLRLWTRTCQRLPKRLWFFNAVVCGVTAVIMSLVVIGGIPYERLLDWGFEEPPKQNLMGAVMDRAKELEGAGDDNLEDAIGDFAGKQDLEAGNDTPKPETPKPKEKERTDCVILGYQLDGEGSITTLYLGTARAGRLVYAGRVSPEFNDEESRELVAAFKSIVIKVPFISMPVEGAVWVRPKLICRVTFAKQSKDGGLRDVEWEKMLGSMRVK